MGILTHLLIHDARADFHRPLPRWQFDHALVPCADMRNALPDLVPRLHEDLAKAVVPRNKRHVGKSHLVADEPLGIGRLGCQNTLEDTQDALDLGGVPLDSRRELFLVEVLEPAALAKVRALAARLEVQVLVALVALLQRAV